MNATFISDQLDSAKRICSLRPIHFMVEKDGDYWLCNCKQTKHRPFCDGTHKEDFVQEVFVYTPHSKS